MATSAATLKNQQIVLSLWNKYDDLHKSMLLAIAVDANGSNEGDFIRGQPGNDAALNDYADVGGKFYYRSGAYTNAAGQPGLTQEEVDALRASVRADLSGPDPTQGYDFHAVRDANAQAHSGDNGKHHHHKKGQ